MEGVRNDEEAGEATQTGEYVKQGWGKPSLGKHRWNLRGGGDEVGQGWAAGGSFISR